MEADGEGGAPKRAGDGVGCSAPGLDADWPSKGSANLLTLPCSILRFDTIGNASVVNEPLRGRVHGEMGLWLRVPALAAASACVS
jgi:hypothetical protein